MSEKHHQARQRISSVSRRFAKACLGLMVLGPVVAGVYWLTAGAQALSISWLDGVVPIHALTPFLRIVCFGLTLLAALPLLRGLNHLRRLFLLYANGTMFGEPNVAALRGFGQSLILFAVAQALFRPVIAVALSAGNPPGARVLSIEVTTGMVVAGFVGGVLLVIAWVMDEARMIDEEQQLTV